MDYSLADHYLGYRLSQKEALLSLFTLTSIPLGKRHYELAKEQPEQWLGHTVLCVVHCTPLVGIIAAAFEYAITFMLFQMSSYINWKPIANTLDLKHRVHIPTDTLRPYPSPIQPTLNPSLLPATSSENRTPIINPQTTTIASQPAVATSTSTINPTSDDLWISQLYPTLPADPHTSTIPSEPSPSPWTPTINPSTIDPWISQIYPTPPTDPQTPTIPSEPSPDPWTPTINPSTIDPWISTIDSLPSTEPQTPTGPEDSTIDVSETPLPTEIIYTDSRQLLSAGEEYFNTYVPPPPLTFPTINITGLTFSNLLSNLLNQYDGICIGESHDHSSPKYLLATSMPLFAQLGVDTLYLEGYDGMQDELDAYFSGDSLEIPDALKTKINEFDSTHDPYYTEHDVLIAAKTAGIRMVNIDSPAAHVRSRHRSSGLGGIRGILRIAAMNYQAKLIIDRDRASRPHGKCIIYAGAAHTSRVAGVPSLGQIYQFPAIEVSDRATSFRLTDEHRVPPYTIQKETVEKDYTNFREYNQDFLIKMHKPRK